MEVAGLIQHREMPRDNFVCRLMVLAWLSLVSSTALPDVLGGSAEFDIPAQPVRFALLEFSEQADVQVMGSSTTFGNLQSTAIKGKLRPTVALRRLLRNTGLKYQTARHAVIIRPIVTADVESPPAGGAIDIPAPRTEQRAVMPMGNMIVTGSHIHNGELVGSSLIVIDRKVIDRSGYSTAQDVVRGLPQNFGGGPSEDSSLGGGNVSRGSGLNLRGLGAGSTLVLVNGRRIAPGGSQSAFVDVSNIPLSAVSRIEVLTDGASAIYGSDAVGGVVNFVMLDDLEGAQTQGSFGTVSRGSLQQTNVSQLFGSQWSTGHLAFAYEFSHRDALPASARDLSADSDLRRFGGSDFSVRQASPGNLVVGNQWYAIPQSRTGLLTPDSFVPGTVNLRNTNRGRDLISEQERHSAFLTLSQSIGDALTLSGDALFSHRTADALNPASSAVLDVPATNPFRIIPTGASAAGRYSVYYSFADVLGSRTFNADVDMLATALEAKLRLSRRWQVTGTTSHSQEAVHQHQGNYVRDAALRAALADSNPVTAFNPFGDVSANNPATLDRIRGTTFYAYRSDLDEFNLTANGKLFEIPGGDIELAVGADYREQRFQTRWRDVNATAVTASRYSRDVTAAFAELRVPLFSRDNSLPGLERVDLAVAGRYEDYSDAGTTFIPRFGVEWSPLDGLVIHGNRGKSFRAPNLPDLDVSKNLTYIANVEDPRAKSGFSPVLLRLGNNAALTAESARTWSVGIKWLPQGLSDRMLDLSYFNISFRDRIQMPTNGIAVLTDAARYAGIILSNPSPAQREEACREGAYLGNVSSAAGDCLTAPIAAIVDARLNNSSETTTRGLDLTGKLEFDTAWGHLGLNGNLSYVLDFSEAQSPTVVPTSLVDTVSNPLRFKMRDSITWSRDQFSATAFVTYAGSYVDNVSDPDRRIGSWTTMDLQMSYAADAMDLSWLSGCTVTLSVQNLFDKDPPFVNNPDGVGYDRENAELLNRFVSLRISKDW